MLKRYFILVAVIALVVGCKTVDTTVSYYDACMSDPACAAEVQLIQNTTNQAVAATVDRQTPFAGIIGVSVGALIAFICAVQKGAKVIRS